MPVQIVAEIGRERGLTTSQKRGAGGGASPASRNQERSSALLLVVLDFLELGVDDVVVARTPASARLLRIAIDLLSKACRRGAQRLELGFDRGLAVALQRLLELRDRGLDLRPLLRRHLVAEILQRLLRRVHERIALVAQV